MIDNIVSPKFTHFDFFSKQTFEKIFQGQSTSDLGTAV